MADSSSPREYIHLVSAINVQYPKILDRGRAAATLFFFMFFFQMGGFTRYVDDRILDHDMQIQHLIEECILFHMSKEECMEALFKHANIKPVITATG